ncbi:hypothetical protein [Nocardia macrotermitis]|uniref:Uncharacterized protein n=1 Tax=Nocardia macrotermitis TaxID=2585198 RepID=A0A7K0DC05_9NOCA|nr:hypothetical protein [Nocardia macrotermitis]MQY23208.1 hypothetical protein [Nocardia macrotermitis]
MTRRAGARTARPGYLGRPALALLIAAAIDRAVTVARHRKDSQ